MSIRKRLEKLSGRGALGGLPPDRRETIKDAAAWWVEKKEAGGEVPTQKDVYETLQLEYDGEVGISLQQFRNLVVRIHDNFKKVGKKSPVKKNRRA